MANLNPMDEPWEEALDLEDTSPLLPSLRSHKRPNTHRQTPTSSSQPFLRGCVQTPQILPSLSPPRLIPGPAGTVQAAMHRRKNRNGDNFVDVGEEPIGTQEYIRRAVEGGACDEDDDFDTNPWLLAVDFVRRQGLVDGDGAIGTPLKAIKNRANEGKVAQVVAIVKSCTPNGLGDLMVKLKDPTGTIDASIHRGVVNEGTFGKNISIGAAIIIQKVAVFSPSRSAYYLNITLDNVIQVIPKNGETPLQQDISGSRVEHAASRPEHRENSERPQPPSLLQGRTKEIISSLRQNASVGLNTHNGDEMETEMATRSTCWSNQNVGEGNLNSRNSVANTAKGIAVEKGVNNSNKEFIHECQRGNGNAMEVAQCCSSQENGRDDQSKQMQSATSKVQLPHWTDEQLDQLFAFD